MYACQLIITRACSKIKVYINEISYSKSNLFLIEPGRRTFFKLRVIVHNPVCKKCTVAVIFIEVT